MWFENAKQNIHKGWMGKELNLLIIWGCLKDLGIVYKFVFQIKATKIIFDGLKMIFLIF